MIEQLTLEVRYRWWLKLYLYGVVWMVYVMDIEPDWDKVERAIAKGVIVRTKCSHVKPLKQ